MNFVIFFCCIFIYFVIRIVLHMNKRSQLCSITTLQFLSIDCFNTPTNKSLQIISPCLSSVDVFVSCSYSKAIRCRTKKHNSSVAHEPTGFPIILSNSSKVPVLLLFSYLIYIHGTLHTCCP